ncbi:putative phage abortive infection protein [Chryseobacterium sp. 52]|uniref:putative phage abortive infection protein n=1 Tax=Chryseobacterium sp. 52 TaxID=2035213 RepID=UPI0015D4E397|nr:putative phage abortive infection protein [Chryseobacterium sp. 52]
MNFKIIYNTKMNFKFIIIASCSIILFTIGCTLLFGLGADEDKRGTFGDMFGFANALFTGLSFIGLIITILLQRQDINNQRQDAKIQNFEVTFFNLLNFHRETINSLEKHYTKRVQTGMQIRSEEYSKKGVQLIHKIYQQYIESLPIDKEFNKQVYQNVYKLNWDVLGHYYRGIQAILDFVDRLNLTSQDEFYYKKIYFDLIKSQLSEYETAMIFYHFLFLDDGHYKKLAEQYCLFEYVNDELITNDKQLYNKYAFRS